MSATATPTQDVFAVDEDVVDEIEQGGSPADQKVQADDSDGKTGAEGKGEEPESGGEAEGEEPEVKDGAGKAPDAWQEEKRELETQLAEARQTFADIRAIAKTNPEVAKAFGLAPEGGSSSGSDWRASVEKSVRDGFVAEKGGDAIMAALTPILDQLETVLRDVGPVKQTVGRLAQTTAASTFRNGLEKRKVPVDNPAFQRLLAQKRKSPRFQSLEAQGDELAIDAAADAWFAQGNRAATNGAARVQLEAAKSGKTATKTGGAALAEKIVKFTDGFDPHRHMRLLAEADKAGRPRPNIVYEDT